MEDVIIIGGGICGCSLGYELSRYNLKVTLLEKENDVSLGTTKANSAIIHAGYDPKPDTKMAAYNVLGNKMIKEICEKLFVSYEQVGSMVLAFDEEQETTLLKLYERGLKNSVPDLKIIDRAVALELEPNLNPDVKAALLAPSAAIVSPWGLCLAMAQSAVLNGMSLHLNTKVTAISKSDGCFTVKTNKGEFQSLYVVNAAGIFSDEINDMTAEHDFTITPSLGEYFLLDKNQGSLVSHVIFQCPDKNGKGVLVAPTVDGNLIVGPNSTSTQKDNLATTSQGLATVRTMAVKSVPSINFRESIRNFCGLRATTQKHDFIVGESPTQKGFFNIGGIKSPGLSSAPAISLDIIKMLKASGLAFEGKSSLRKLKKPVRFRELSPAQRAEIIKQNPLYGSIVCRCETITEGEIIDALKSPIPPCSLDGVKRRCSAGMGRCQGGFCGPKVMQIIARELNINQADIPLDREGMYIIAAELG